MDEIRCGFYKFFPSQLYRVSGLVRDKDIAGKKVWIKAFLNANGCDWLLVAIAETGKEYLVKPCFVSSRLMETS